MSGCNLGLFGATFHGEFRRNVLFVGLPTQFRTVANRAENRTRRGISLFIFFLFPNRQSSSSAGLAHVSRDTARAELHVRGSVSSLGCTVAKGFVGLILSFVLRSGSEILPYAATHNPTCAICAPPKANHELHTSTQSCDGMGKEAE